MRCVALFTFSAMASTSRFSSSSSATILSISSIASLYPVSRFPIPGILHSARNPAFVQDCPDNGSLRHALSRRQRPSTQRGDAVPSPEHLCRVQVPESLFELFEPRRLHGQNPADAPFKASLQGACLLRFLPQSGSGGRGKAEAAHVEPLSCTFKGPQGMVPEVLESCNETVLLLPQCPLRAPDNPGLTVEDPLLEGSHPADDELRHIGGRLALCVRHHVHDRVVPVMAYAGDDRQGESRHLGGQAVTVEAVEIDL